MTNNTTSADASKSTPHPFIDLENIYGLMTVALTFNEAAQRFMQSGLVHAVNGDTQAKTYIAPEIERTLTMLCELDQRLSEAKDDLDAFIDAVPADRLMVERTGK